jgi:hypothetical protein
MILMKIQDSKLNARQVIQGSFVPLACYISPELEFPVATFGAKAASPPSNNNSAASRMMENCMPARSAISSRELSPSDKFNLTSAGESVLRCPPRLSSGTHPACQAAVREHEPEPDALMSEARTPLILILLFEKFMES